MIDCDRCKHTGPAARWAGDELGWLCISCAYRYRDAVERATPERIKDQRRYGDLR